MTQGAALNSVLPSTLVGPGSSQNITGFGGLPGQTPGSGAYSGQGGRTNNSTASFNGTAQGPGATNNQTLRNSLTSRATTNNQTSTIPTLKEGLSVNVTITTQQDNNVILVPSKAVTRQGVNNIVQVLNSDNTTTTQVVTVGLSDYANKEITSGLTAGEKIVITSTTSSATTTTTTSTQTTTGTGNSGIQIPGLTGGGGATGFNAGR